MTLYTIRVVLHLYYIPHLTNFTPEAKQFLNVFVARGPTKRISDDAELRLDGN